MGTGWLFASVWALGCPEQGRMFNSSLLLVPSKGAAIGYCALMLFSHIPLCKATLQVWEGAEQCPASHIPAPVSWALAQTYPGETGGCSPAAVGIRGCRNSKDVKCGCRMQQPDIPVLRGGCSIDEQGKGVTSVWQSSVTLCILSILLVMLKMCGFMCAYI